MEIDPPTHTNIEIYIYIYIFFLGKSSISHPYFLVYAADTTMVYIEINGVRLGQEILLAIVETVIAHCVVAALFLTVHLPCLHPKTHWSTRRWVRPWKFYLTVYSIMSLLSEIFWIQIDSLSDINADENGFVCVWSQGHLTVWTMVQLSVLVGILLTWSYSRRVPVALTIRGLCGTHAMTMMAMAMAGMYENGPCGALVFPLLTSSIGMSITCCCMPWHMGAWDMHPPPNEGVIPDSDEERIGFTTMGWWYLSRQRRKLRRRLRETPYETLAQLERREKKRLKRKARASSASFTDRICTTLRRSSGSPSSSSSSSEEDTDDFCDDTEHDDDTPFMVEFDGGEEDVSTNNGTGKGKSRGAQPLLPVTFDYELGSAHDDIGSSDSQHLLVDNPQNWEINRKQKGQRNNRGGGSDDDDDDDDRDKSEKSGGKARGGREHADEEGDEINLNAV